MLIIDTVGIKRPLYSLTTKYSIKLKNLPTVVLPYAGRAAKTWYWWMQELWQTESEVESMKLMLV
jgi:hypothetical protein